MNINTRRLADTNTVEVQDTVRKIRSQRAFSIQMPDQYVFCHTALVEHAQREGLLSGSDMDGLEDSSSDSDWSDQLFWVYANVCNWRLR